MEFEINGDTWTIKELSNNLLLKLYKAQSMEDDVYHVEGITIYSQHSIGINEADCEENKIKTLKHELTHCYIKEYGLYNIPNYNEEMVCDLVASINDFITDTVNKWKKFISKEN